jgi:hypothetical protein
MDRPTMNFQQLVEDAKKDPSLLSTINIDELVSNMDTENSPYLWKTQKEIEMQILSVLVPHYKTDKSIFELCKKLVGYRYVDELYQLHRGKHVRWLRYRIGERPLDEDAMRLTNGGIVVDLKFGENGASVLVRVPGAGFFTQYKFDECYTFQKLTDEENMVLFCNTVKL